MYIYTNNKLVYDDDDDDDNDYDGDDDGWRPPRGGVRVQRDNRP